MFVVMVYAGTLFCRRTRNKGLRPHQSNHVPSPKIQGRRQRMGAVCCDKRPFQANAKVLALKLPPQGVHVGRDLGLTIKNAVPPSHISACMQQTNTSSTGRWSHMLVTNYNHTFQPVYSQGQRNSQDAFCSSPHLIIESQLSGTCRQSGSTKHPRCRKKHARGFCDTAHYAGNQATTSPALEHQNAL